MSSGGHARFDTDTPNIDKGLQTKDIPAQPNKPDVYDIVWEYNGTGTIKGSVGSELDPRTYFLKFIKKRIEECLSEWNRIVREVRADVEMIHTGIKKKKTISAVASDPIIGVKVGYIIEDHLKFRSREQSLPPFSRRPHITPTITVEGLSSITSVHWAEAVEAYDSPHSPPSPLPNLSDTKSSTLARSWRSNVRHSERDSHQRRGNPFVPSLNTKPRENRRKVLRVRIKGKDHLACPDSGSEKNIISKACAVEHGFRIRRKAQDIKRFEVGNGDIVWSIGRVSEIVGLPGSPLWKKKRWFYVLENCPVPLVMGMKFLREAEILTRYRHLLESCPIEMSKISSLMWIGSPQNRLRCTLDRRQLEVVADTGSDLNLMSLACAEREGFCIDRRTESRTQIVVGSGKVIETVGQVYVSNLTLDWREPEADSPEQSSRTPTTGVQLEPDPNKSAHSPREEDDETLYLPFHVVENLPCDIIFGQELLDDTDAFNKCPELLEIPPTKQNRQFEKHKQQYEFKICISNIFSRRRPPKKLKLPVDIRGRHQDDWHDERYRRSQNTEEKIALLPLCEQEAARRCEAKKVREWHIAHSKCQFCKCAK